MPLVSEPSSDEEYGVIGKSSLEVESGMVEELPEEHPRPTRSWVADVGGGTAGRSGTREVGAGFLTFLMLYSMAMTILNIRQRYNRPNCKYYHQDTWVLELFRHRGFGDEFKGFYLDIGSHDGIRDSTTYLFDRLGWQGHCIDPLPMHMEKRTCALTQAVASDRTGDKVMFLDCKWNGTDGGVGGFSGVKGLGEETHDVSRCNEVELETTDIVSILDENQVPRTIDYISLDVEGAEFQVVHALVHGRFCGRAWTIEHNNQEPKRSQIRKLLEDVCKCKRQHVFCGGVDDAYLCPCDGMAWPDT